MEVNLVTVKTEKVPVLNRDYVRVQHMECVPIRNSNDVIPESFVECKDIPIEYWREHTRRGTVETALAVHPDVKRILLSLKVPELLESVDREQKRSIQVIKSQRKVQEDFLNKLIDERDTQLHIIRTSTWWTRLKWVFTGVNDA